MLQLRQYLREPDNPDPNAGEELKLPIVNSTWGQMDYYFEPEYLDIPALYYGAGMNPVDFINQPDPCRILINDWVAGATEQNSMIIILPEAGMFQQLESSLNNNQLNAINQGLSSCQVILTMPRFCYEWENSLKATLQSLGMTDAFIENVADFSGINGQRDLLIHDAFHKAFTAVDEIGTEAAAATAIVIGITSIPPSTEMILNRPFIFVIYNNDTEAVLFLGRVMQP